MSNVIGSVKQSISTSLSKSLDLSTLEDPLSQSVDHAFTGGTGALQANEQWHDKRTVAASATDQLDLSGSLTNAFGESVEFTSIKAIQIKNVSGNGASITVGPPAVNGWVTLMAASDVITLEDGAAMTISTPTAGGYAVAAGTGDLLDIVNLDGANAAEYEIVLIGNT